jgi:SpoVK/Ycf46/Vps4 family AAA+-type ATPase
MKTNLDKAFERRFLYKLDFEKPDAETRAAIWKEFIPALCENDALALASRFNFSGGQIENVARKNAVSFLLSGEQATVKTLSALCEEEPAEPGTVRIGFL